MITSDNPNEVDQLRRWVFAKANAELPAEKARARSEQTKIADKLAREGSVSVKGIGQKIGSIDRRTYFRLEQENPGCMRDRQFVNELLRDSPKLRAQGYIPQTLGKTGRKTFAYVDGVLTQIA